MNGYNFTQRVRMVLALAREESARLGHAYVGTEHILLALIREGEGVAATVLANLDLSGDDLAADVEALVRPGENSRRGADLPYTSRVKKALELSMAEARDLCHAYVGTEHLLLGLLREAGGIGAQALLARGVTLDAARAEIRRILGETPVASDRSGLLHAARAGMTATPAAPDADMERRARFRAGAPLPGTHHLLVALLLMSPEIAAVFEEQGITATAVRDEARRMSG
jgi:ATP-dependent Clp protease ATP-binding subunit ClpC